MEQENKQKPISKDYLTSSLKDFDSEVLDKKYLKSDDEQLHTHANKEVLNRFNVSDTGALLFDGNEVNTDSQALRQLIDLSYANANGYTDEKIAGLINGAPSTLDTLKEIADALEENDDVVQALHDAIGSKTDQADLETVAFSGSYHDLIDKPLIPTSTSQLINDTGFKSSDDEATILTQTLAAGTTSLTFMDSSITDDSIIDIYTDPFCNGLTSVVQDGSTLTLTFDAQEVSMRVRVKVG